MKALLEKIRKILRNRRTRQLLARTVSGFAAVVVFVTTYALVLPAITMEQEASCGITAHEHTDACYEERLVCQIPEDENHHHDASCYEKFLICGQQVHVHSTECYQQYTSAVVSSGSTTAASTDLGALVESELYSRDDSGDDAGSILTDSGSNALETVEEDSSASVEDSDLAADTNPESEATDPEASGNGISENTDSVTTNPVDAESQSSEENKIAAPEENRDAAPEENESVACEGETGSRIEGVNDDNESLGLETADSPDLNDGSGSVSDASDRSAADTSDAGQEFNDSAAGTSDVKTENAETAGAESAETAYTESAETAGTEAAAQEAANSATTNVLPEAAENENLTEGYVPELDSIEFGSVLNMHTDFYYFHPEEGQEIPASSAEITDWKKVKNDLFGSTRLESTDLVKLYLSYTIPAGALNETNQVARYRLPSNIHLTDEQIIAINGTENGMSAIYAEADLSDTEEAARNENAANYQKYLGVEAIEGTRTPDRIRKEDEQEFISAIVKAENVFDDEGLYGEKGAFLGQDLIFIFTPYSIEKNQTTYNADGNPLSAGEKITGWFACDFNMSQIDWVEEDTDLDNSTVEKTAEIVFVEKDSEKNLKEISRTLKLVDVTGDQSDAANDGETAVVVETEAAAEIAETAATASETAATDETALASTGNTSDQAAAEDKENGPFKSGTLTADGDGYRITLDYSKEAKIPENAELSVREITTETDREAYEACLEQAGQQVAADEKTGVDQKASRFFDIEILVKDTDSEGNEKTRKIEPSAPVSVNIQIIDDQAAEDAVSADQKASQGDPAVLHFAEKGVEQIDSTVKNSQEQTVSEGKEADKESESAEPVTEISFEAESFSIYGVVYTVDFHWEVDGKTFDFSMPGGGFVSLEHLVEALAVIENANSAGNNENSVKTLSDEDAQEQVDMTLDDIQVGEGTVDFVADVEKVEFSNPELLSVSKVEENTTVGEIKDYLGLKCEYSAELTGDQIEKINATEVKTNDWALIGIKAFTTKECLTVTMNTGECFRIKVTDNQLRKEVLMSNGESYDVTVIYGKEANIADDAHLEVTEYEKGSAEYENARKAVLADKQAKGEVIDLDQLGFAALDISILDKEGNEIEPAKEVQVDIRIKSLPGVEDIKIIEDKICIQHHVETEEGVIVDEVFGGKTDAIFDMQSNEDVKEEKSDAVVDPMQFNEEEYRKAIEEQKRETEKSKDAATVSFATPGFSTFTVTWPDGIFMPDNKTTIHYGYMENGTFHEFSQQPSPTTTTNANDAYLIYDFEGYHYAEETYYRTSPSDTPASGGKTILPELWPSWRMDFSYKWQYATGDKYQAGYYTDGSPYYELYKYDVANNSHVYMIYEKDATPPTGGTPNVDELTDPPSEPKILKDSVENGDGTNTLSLSIIGDNRDSKVTKLADVIVVFDVSGSMREDMDGNDTDVTDDQRLTISKEAVSKVADVLLSPNEAGKVPRIRMALVPFATRVQKDKVVGLTGDLTTFKNGVNNEQLTAYGATNWEEALQYANNMAVDSDRATFIIFVTDGNPTVRMTRGNLTNAQLDQFEERVNGYDYTGMNSDDLFPNQSVFGSGTTDKFNRNYNAALNIATEITKPAAKKNFYSIAISNDANKLGGFTQAATGETDRNYTATNAVGLEDAFDDILAKMSATFGWGDIQMTDGITDLINTVEKSGLTNVDEGTFRYWRASAPENWETMTDAERKAYEKNLTSTNAWVEWIPGADGKLDDGARGKANPATFENGAVKWNFGTNYMLEKDVIYRVTFDCWPKQEALDILSNLRNGTQFYDYASYSASNPDPLLSENEAKTQGIVISDDEHGQIVRNGDSYSVKTNAPGACTTYKTAVEQEGHTGTGGNDHGPLFFQEVDPMPINSNKMKVVKEWAHGINSGHQADTVKFHLLVDGKYYMNDGSLADALIDGNRNKAYVIEVGDNNNWHYDDVYIAPGIVRNGKVLETGHTYALEEFETHGDDNYDFSYEFKTQYVRPMNVDVSASSSDTVKYLVEVDAENPGTGAQHRWIKDSASAGAAGTYALTDNEGTEYYIAADNGKGVIQATNHKTSELDITKLIVKGEGAEDKTETQLNQETFMYRVTLEVPAGANIDGIQGAVYFRYPIEQFTPAGDPFDLYGYTRPDDATAFENDIDRFDLGKVFRPWNTTNSVIKSRLLTVRSDGTQVIEMDIPQSRKEVIRFTNLPTGTRYTIQEVYANKTKPAARTNAIEGTVPSTDPSNLADQGYTVTQIRSKNSNQTDDQGVTLTSTDTVTGTISKPDTRYYNQFTNTLGKHVDVKIDVTKHLEGYEWTGEKYYFKLSAGTNTAGVTTPMPLTGYNPIFVTNTSGSSDMTYGFDKIRFVRTGTYNYTIKEVDVNGNSLAGQIIDGVKYDGIKNIKVTVTEENNKYIATVTGDDITAQEETGLVTSTTKFTNARGSVKVKKTDKNTNALISGAVFELYKGSEKLYLRGNMVITAAEVRDAIDIEAAVSLDSEEAKTKMQAEGINAAFTIGEQALKNLAFGVDYTLREVNPPDGYIISQNESVFKLTVNAQGDIAVELTGNNASQSMENDIIVISISNEPGASLPSTGGPGTRMLYLLGTILTAIAAAGLVMLRLRSSRAA